MLTFLKLLFVVSLSIYDGCADPRKVALIQGIDTVSIEKGVDVITSQTRKNIVGDQRGLKDSEEFLNQPQDYSGSSKDNSLESIEHEIRAGK